MLATTCLLVGVASVSAAPPTITSLSPAGVQLGTERALSVRGNLKTRPISVWCDQPDIGCVLADDQNELTVNVPAETPPGRCWIRLHNAEGASDLFPLAIGLLPEMTETEPNNRIPEATAVSSLPMTVDGGLHKSNEVDLFAVPLAAGQQLVAAVESREPLGGPADVVAQLVSPDGFVLVQNDDYAGMDPLLTYHAEQAGTVYVRLFAFPATPDSSIRFAGGEDYVYRLTLTTGPFLSHVLTTPTGPDHPARATLIGWNVTDANADPEMTPGLHWLQSHRRLTGVAAVPADAGATLPESAALDWSQAIVGNIKQPGQVDRFRYSAKKGATVNFEVAGPSVGSRLDPVLQLSDADGKLLKESDDVAKDNQDASLEWKAPEDRDCWVTVRDRFDHAGDDFLYRLTASDQPRPVELTVDADHFVLSRKSPLEITVKVNRPTGDDRPLSISVQDLPDGVTCPAVISEAKGETSKQVKLKLTSGDTPSFNGPIRIVGHVDQATDATAIATAGTRVPGTRTTSLWLTILVPDHTETK